MYYPTDKEIDFLNRHGWKVDFVNNNYYTISYNDNPYDIECYLEGPLLGALYQAVCSDDGITAEWRWLMNFCDTDQQILKRVRFNQALKRLHSHACAEVETLI